MVISLSAKGLTHGEISAHLAEIYGAQVSKQTISTITDERVTLARLRHQGESAGEASPQLLAALHDRRMGRAACLAGLLHRAAAAGPSQAPPGARTQDPRAGRQARTNPQTQAYGRPVTISRCGPTGVPLDRIADELEAAGTARVSMDVLVQKVPAIPQQRGLWDFERELGILRFMRKDTPVDLLHAGPDIYRLLSPQEQKATGKLWRWEERRPSNWATDHAETIASIRHLAHSTNLERTEHDVVRYALRITTRPDARDPLLASLHEQVRQFGIKDLAVNVWMTTDGRLCQIRERMKTTRAEIIRDHWDFGVDLPYLAVPPPEQILHEDGGPGGLTVLIDDEPSPY